MSRFFTFLLALGALGLFNPDLQAAAAWLPDPYTSANEKAPIDRGFFAREAAARRTREAAERNCLRVPIQHAVAPEEELAADPNSAMSAQAPLVAAKDDHQALALVTISVLGLILAVRKLGPKIAEILNIHFNPWEIVPCVAADHSGNVLAEAEAFAGFLAAFQAGPALKQPEIKSPDGTPASPATPAPAVVRRDPLLEFFANAPLKLAGLRQLLQDITRETGDGPRHRLIERLLDLARAFKEQTGLPELLPAWQLASALEGLLQQLISRRSHVTPSTLRTVANAVDLLNLLCRPGLKPDLATNPPVRLLAVDDEMISRHAVSFALKKGLNPPDLAERSADALAMAERETYDVIFLDVQMPGMDGFELCSKIHETVANRTTPVVFVTSQSDFNARANSTLSGGHDLIGKPFLTFEITVKALTLVLRGRLEAQAKLAARPAEGETAAAAAGVANPSAPTAAPAPAPAPESPAALAGSARRRRHRNRTRQHRLGRAEQRRLAQTVVGDADPFLTHGALQMQALADLLKEINQATEPEERQDMLLDMYLRVHALTPLADRNELRLAFQVSQALEGLLKKLVDKPSHISPSTLHTVAGAVDLLKDLCAAGLNPVLAASAPPIRLLVVDDDAITRRAMTGALQTVFEKPESADGGEAALTMAAEKPFDVIFLDVCMPGLDGFAVCAKLRETPTHRQTPIVFVTGHADEKARAQAAACGGSDLIAKPFLAIEITLKALIFALRRRLPAAEEPAGSTPPQQINLPEPVPQD